jgi:hypothetical protein
MYTVPRILFCLLLAIGATVNVPMASPKPVWFHWTTVTTQAFRGDWTNLAPHDTLDACMIAAWNDVMENEPRLVTDFNIGLSPSQQMTTRIEESPQKVSIHFMRDDTRVFSVEHQCLEVGKNPK